jgi:hypothetical protein
MQGKQGGRERRKKGKGERKEGKKEIDVRTGVTSVPLPTCIISSN